MHVRQTLPSARGRGRQAGGMLSCARAAPLVCPARAPFSWYNETYEDWKDVVPDSNCEIPSRRGSMDSGYWHQHEKLRRCYALVTAHEQKMGWKYDYVAKLRADLKVCHAPGNHHTKSISARSCLLFRHWSALPTTGRRLTTGLEGAPSPQTLRARVAYCGPRPSAGAHPLG